MAVVLPEGRQSFTTNAGLPLVGGKLYTYQPGTTTPKATFTDSTGVTPNTNPVIANARGEMAVYWDGPYDVTLKDASDNLIWGPERLVTPEAAGAAAAVDAALRSDLASIASTTKGGGMIGFDPTLAYPANTIGRSVGDREINPRDFPWLAKFDGTTNDTAAINAAMDYLESLGGGVLRLPRGTCKAAGIELRPGVDFIGQGSRAATVIEAASSNTAIFKKKPAATTIETIRCGGFLVRAHASGSTGAVFELTGSRASEYSHIEYRANANGTGTFKYLFDLSASPSLCYANHFKQIYVSNQKAPEIIWRLNNAGAGAAFNPNVGSIKDCWIVDNTNITTICDLVRSVGWQVSNCIFENNTGATGISPGQACTIGPDNFFELMTNNIVYENPEAGARGENGIVIGNYFTTADTIDCTSGRGNVWLNNTEAGAQTFSNNSDGLNLKLKQQDAVVTAPTLAYQSGQTGTLTLVSNSRVGAHDFSGSTYQLVYSWTATVATTLTELALSIPSGYVIETISAGMIRSGTGEPAKVAPGVPSGNGRVWLANAFNDIHTLTVFVRYRRSIS